MEKTNVQKLAKILKILVTITFICNLLMLPIVPGLVGLHTDGGWFAFWGIAADNPLPEPVIFLAVCWQYLFRVWRDPYAGFLAGFLMACGVCTAIILWQARRVLDTILEGNPFQDKNGENMKRAAVCCFVIAGAALFRSCWRLWHYEVIAYLLTYNTLFAFVFSVGGLLCMVMSALFRQAAELKEENDLTI